MKIDITGRHIRVTQALRKLATERIEKIARHVGGASEAQVMLEVEKRRHIAEVTLVGKRGTIASQGETEDMYASLSLVLDRLERRAKKSRDKLIGKKRRGKKAPAAAAPEEEAVPVEDDERAVVIEAEPYRAPSLSVEDALMKLGGEELPFVLFRDAASERLSLLYRKPDGRFALLEPES